VTAVEQFITWIRGMVASDISVRTSRLITVLALVMVPILAVDLLSSTTTRHPTVGLLALAAVVAWFGMMWTRRDLPLWWDALPPVGLVVIAWSLGDGESVRGVLVLALFVRVFRGTRRDAVVNTVLYVAAMGAALLLTGSGFVAPVLNGLLALVVAAVARIVGSALRELERTARHDAVLADVRLRLQGATDRDEAYAAAVDGARSLLAVAGEVSDIVVTVWSGDKEDLLLQHGAGRLPPDLPTRLRVASLPPDVRALLLSGAPFRLDEDGARATQQSIGMEPVHVSMQVAPFTRGGTFTGVLMVSAAHPLPDDLGDPLAELSLGVGFLLDRMHGSALLRRIVDNSFDAILLLNDDHTIRYASKAITPALGYEPSALVGSSLEDLMATAAHLAETHLRRAQSATSVQGPEVVRLRHQDGTERDIELVATRLTNTRQPGWVVNLRDVTARRATERALHMSEAYARSIADNISEGLFRLSLDGRPTFEYVNPALEHICGLDADEFYADSEITFKHVHADDRELLMRTRTEPEAVDWPVEIRWDHPHRGWRWLSLTESPILDEDGRARLSMGIVSDVTARKEQEATLQAALEKERHAAAELRQVDAMKTAFLQAVSHELRTPLTAIVGYAQTLARTNALSSDPTKSMLLERLTASATRLQDLLTDLLDVDRLASGVLVPNRRPTDLLALCLRVVEQMEVDTSQVTCRGDAFIADVDAPKVERVVENLVSNAVRHAPAGTGITVEVRDVGDSALIAVEDDGPGVAPDLRERIFEPFEQGPEAATSASPGTGIGLSLVSKFAELHGGVAWVEETPTGGARFCVRLPKKAPEDGGPAADGYESRSPVESLG
jgi:PAS domain S-box-containing protein